MISVGAFQAACEEWMRGCSCATKGKPWECDECTAAFHARLQAIRPAPVDSCGLPEFGVGDFLRQIGKFLKAVWDIADGATEPAVITRAKIARARQKAGHCERE